MSAFCQFCGCHHNPVEECSGGYEYPHYPLCPGCDRETSNAAGFCLDCESYPHEWKLIPLTEVRGDPFLNNRRAA